MIWFQHSVETEIKAFDWKRCHIFSRTPPHYPWTSLCLLELMLIFLSLSFIGEVSDGCVFGAGGGEKETFDLLFVVVVVLMAVSLVVVVSLVVWWWKRDVWPSFRHGGGVDGGGGHGVDGVVHENDKIHLSRIITTGHSRLQVDSANLTYSHFQLVL